MAEKLKIEIFNSSLHCLSKILVKEYLEAHISNCINTQRQREKIRITDFFEVTEKRPLANILLRMRQTLKKNCPTFIIKKTSKVLLICVHMLMTVLNINLCVFKIIKQWCQEITPKFKIVAYF